MCWLGAKLPSLFDLDDSAAGAIHGRVTAYSRAGSACNVGFCARALVSDGT